jgi:hypothetical protein
MQEITLNAYPAIFTLPKYLLPDFLVLAFLQDLEYEVQHFLFHQLVMRLHDFAHVRDARNPQDIQVVVRRVKHPDAKSVVVILAQVSLELLDLQ